MMRFHVHLAAGALALLAVASPLTAQSWTPLGPFGGPVTSLVIDPARPDTLYAAVPSGTFKSAEAGASWTVLPGAPGRGLLAIDPGRPATLYATTGYPFAPGISKSTDGGATWRASVRGLPANSGQAAALAIDPSRPSRLYLGLGNTGLWKSEDSGATWQRANQGFQAGDHTSVSALAVPPRPSGTAFAGTFVDGVYRTTNGGRSWTPLRNGLPEEWVAALAVAPSDPRAVYASLGSGIYRSTDGGASWQSAGSPAPESGPAVALAVHPRLPGTVYAGNQAGGLFQTTDGGATWARVGGTGEAGVLSLAIHPRAPQVVYAGMFSTGAATGGVLRTADGGATWIQRSRGLAGLQATAVAADPGAPRVLLASTLGPGLFRTGDQGSNWDRTPLGFPNRGGVRVADVFATAPGTFYALIEAGTLWKTTDAGASWAQVPLPPGALLLVRRDLEDPDVLYALTSASGINLFRSADGGASWTPLTSPPLSCGPFELTAAPSPSGPPILYVGGAVSTDAHCGSTQARIVRSLDGGLTWVPTTGDLPGESVVKIAVDPVDPDVLYAGLGRGLSTVAQNGVWKSEDAGASWREAGPELRFRPVYDIAVSTVPGRLYAEAGFGAVFQSDNGGESWRDVSAGLQTFFVDQLLLDPHDPSRLYAATFSGVWALTEEP